MALQDIISPFQWGAAGAKLSPEEIARQRQIADALLQQGVDFSPIASPLQGLARVANAAAGAYGNYRAGKAEESNAEANGKIIASLLGGGSDVFPAAPGMSDAPDSASQPTASPVATADVPTQRVASAFATSDPDTGAGATGWLDYANKNAIRNQPLDPKLTNALSFLPDMGVTMKVFSGGQDATGSRRTGSHRHDNGDAADVFFYKDGRQLDWNNPQDVPIYQQIVERAKANGVTGFGAGEGYMRPGSMHIGFGTPAVWGAGGRGTNAPDWLRQAFNTPYEASPAVAATNAMADNAPSVPPLPDAVNVPDMPIAGQPVQVAQNVNPNQMSDATALSLLGASAYKPGDVNPAIVQALSDPRSSDMTRQIATMLVKQKLDPNAALETEYKRAQIAKLQREAQTAGTGVFGTPIYGKDPQTGQTVLGAIGKDGTFHKLDTGGVQVTPGVTWQDFGTYRQAFDKSGAPVNPGVAVDNEGKAADTKTGQIKGEQRATQPQAAAALGSAVSSLDRMGASVQQLIDDPALGRITGVMGMIPNYPGGEAAGAQARLNTLKSQIGFAVLQAMRDASKTGGALGQVSDTENKMLQNNLASLEQAQSEEDLKRELKKILDFVAGSKQRLQNAYSQTYGGGGSASTAPAASSAPSGGVVDYRDYFGGR